MSAYASLPGSFLPPFFAFGTTPISEDCSNETKADNKTEEKPCVFETISGTSSCAERTATHSTSTSSSSSSCPKFSPTEIDPSAFKALSISTFSSFLEITEPSNEEHEKSSEPTTSASSSSSASEIIIAIKSASVDPVQLVKSLTSRGSKIARRTASFIARTPSCASDERDAMKLNGVDSSAKDNDHHISSSNSISSMKPPLCYEDSDSEDDEEMSFYDYDDDFSNHYEEEEIQHMNHCEDNYAGDDFHKQKLESEKEDASAIQFELSINFQGRKYTATRAFSTFVKLRNDLLRELHLYGSEELDGKISGQQRNRYRRRSREPCRNSSAESLNCVEQELVPEAKPNEFVFKIEDLAQFQQTKGNGKESGAVSIPELPRVSPEDCSGNGSSGSSAWSGVACRGFSYLQSVAKLYCPEMEKWLMQVIDAVPSSPSLSRFLWEPLASSTASWDNIIDDVDIPCDGESVESDQLHNNDAVTNNRGPSLKSSSSHSKPSFQQRKTKSSKFLSKGSLSSLNSIHEADDDTIDEE
eukprot:CAMPEP_0171348370 /NCGR_PEP_ID=MMETSP0878-20121228/30622_1 /TAXON_ID=67004 /ORGANISM="Thalassiosira weissflogii, Strain CCMP1336" /LENGTH=527 /DNA_ID=CAMNT_0011852695 /DNA_START=74 /DNA_END=1657 /DNA_ORIENTATION=-